MKNIKFWTILGVLSLGITCSIAYSSTSKASSGLQSKGKLVYQDPVSQQEVIMDANDHTILKGSIDANSGQILSLKEFQAQQEALNEELQNKDIELENGIQGINDSLGGVTKFVVDPDSGKITGYTTEIGGADSVFPFRRDGIYMPVWYAILNGYRTYLTFDTSNYSTLSIEWWISTLNQARVYGCNGIENVNNDTWEEIVDLNNITAPLVDLDISNYEFIKIQFRHNVAVSDKKFMTNIVIN